MKVAVKYTALVLFIVVLAWCSSGQSRAEVPSLVLPTAKVEKAKCGFFYIDAKTGVHTVHETSLIPGIPGLKYGCELSFTSRVEIILVRSELELPEEPPWWGTDEWNGVVKVSPDRRVGVREDTIPTYSGIFSCSWGYGFDDPYGDHELRFYIDGQTVHVFRFKVFELPPPKGKYINA